MQLIATNVSPVRSASARGHRLRVQAPAAPHLRLTRKQTFSEHFRALRIAPGSGCRLGAIHPTSENRNSPTFISTIPDIHSYRAGAELYSSTSSMLWVGSCGQFALDWFGLPGKRKSSSMHRNVLSTSFRSG